jgi:hypothetical protein
MHRLENLKYHHKTLISDSERGFSVMSHTLLYPARNPKILSWIVQELKKQIPGFDPHGQDRRVLAFAYQDLQTCLGVRWKVVDPYQLRMAVIKAAENRPEEVKAFLKVWTGRWLEKWRERVTLFQKMPRISKRHLRSLRKAKKVYRGMKKRLELKRMVVEKLVNQGEVCMAGLIAETLIIEEIAHQLNRYGGKTSMKTLGLNPAEILQGIITKVENLPNRKSPIIYLKIMIGNWNM